MVSNRTFGQNLRAERERLGLPIDAVAGALRVDRAVVEALERDDYDALPAEPELMACLNGYADQLDVDAELMIGDFVEDRRESRLRAKRAGGGGSRLLMWLVAASMVAVVLLAAWWLLARGGAASRDELPTSIAEADPAQGTTSTISGELEVGRVDGEVIAPVMEPAPLPETTGEPQPEDVSDSVDDDVEVGSPESELQGVPAETAVRELQPEVGGLWVSQHGVGRAVENLQLIGESDSFRLGSRVWFWTRVRDGAPGDFVDHVWYFEGRAVARVRLTIGSAMYRTSSNKLMLPGSAGEWAVEVQDDAGRVLARSEFVCVS